MMDSLVENGYHYALANKVSDLSNSELLFLVMRQVTQEFSVKECFLCYCEFDKIKSEHIAKCIKVSW